MIGKVIEGRYVGANICKHPDKNVLYIETEDGERIALSKKNIVSITDVTDQYPSCGKKVMMVIWDDFETSILQLGVSTSNASANREATANHCCPEKKSSQGKKSKQQKINLPWLLVGICLSIILVLAFFSVVSNQDEIKPKETTFQMDTPSANPSDEISHSDNSTSDSHNTEEKELIIGEWILLDVDGVTLNFRFDGFSPLQDHQPYGTHVYLLCSVENASQYDYDTYSLFEYKITIKDSEGFSVPHSSSGWNYEGYDCFTDISRGEKKKIVQAYDYSGDVSKLSITINAGGCVYTYVHSDEELLSHVGMESTSTTSEASATCGEAVGNELDHVRGEWVTIQNETASFPHIQVRYCTVCGEETNRQSWSGGTVAKDALESHRKIVKTHFLNIMSDYFSFGVEYKDVSYTVTTVKIVSCTEYKVYGIETLIDVYGAKTERKFTCKVVSDNQGQTWSTEDFEH